jgi:hypothetical protein
MIKLDRRRMLPGATASGAVAALTGGTSLDWAKAPADEMPLGGADRVRRPFAGT